MNEQNPFSTYRTTFTKAFATIESDVVFFTKRLWPSYGDPFARLFTTMRKHRNIGKFPVVYKSGQQYTFHGYMSHFPNLNRLLFAYNRPTHIKYLGQHEYNSNLAFAGYERGWKIYEISLSDFFQVFPLGIPNSDGKIDKWIAYTGYMAQKFYRNQVEKEISATENTREDIAVVKEAAKRLKEYGITVEIK